MQTTAILVLALLAKTTINVAIWAALLHLGLRWAKCDEHSKRKLALVTILCTIAIPVQLLPFAALDIGSENVTMQVCLLIAQILLQCWMISRFYGLTLLRAFKAWLPTLLTVVTAVLLALLFRHFAFEAFATPTNSMAPTILGFHATAKCDQCGEICYGLPADPRSGRIGDYAICANFHSSFTRQLPEVGTQGDKILVSKFLTPKRWDVIVFHCPDNPSILHVKRLVGMPNEEIYIQEGRVWIDGSPVTTPDHLGDIKYETEFPYQPADLSGTKANPATLAGDEYFVLGDFTHRSQDSRIWRLGVDGRPPYAVPKSHLLGVVTHVYWPSTRMKVLR